MQAGLSQVRENIPQGWLEIREFCFESGAFGILKNVKGDWRPLRFCIYLIRTFFAIGYQNAITCFWFNEGRWELALYTAHEYTPEIYKIGHAPV